MRLIMVSNRLPVKIDSDGNVCRTTGGLTSALEGANLDVDQVWVGWPGGASEDCENPDQVTETLQKDGFHPVFLSKKEIDGYYEGYSNSTLWPILHYMVERAKFEPQWWKTYQEVNYKFAKAVAEIARPGDQAWVHDYHLFLVPSMLRNMTNGLNIGFFLHTPFSSSEMFRALPNREDILGGVLGSNLIGFQTFDYLRHFRSSLLRILGFELEPDGSLRHEGRRVRMDFYPIGHNQSGYQKILNDESFAETMRKQREALAGKRMILNVERLDYTKGVPEKLAAIRRFFDLHPARVEEIVFVLIAVPSRQGVKEYDDLTERVQREVGAINGDYSTVGHAPVQFFHHGFPMQELAAFYATAEVCMVTPLRDGMNLVAKEFLCCLGTKYMEKPGVLILSEFAGAANELADAIHVNPYDIDNVATAINTALEMPDRERLRRITTMQHRLVKENSATWARRFLEVLGNTPRPETPPLTIQDLPKLTRHCIESVGKGKKLGIFLDYDGTLRDFVNVPEDAVPGQDLVDLLKELAGHKALSLAVISGRPASFLEQHFGNLGITLVGEHGYRWLEDGKGEWKLVNPNVDTDWKDMMREHLEKVALMTPGTQVEEKTTSIVWHYRRADPEFGKWRANALLDELSSMAANLPVAVHHGNKIVEVSSIQVNKGEAVKHLMWHMGSEVAIVAGDDQTDETMLGLHPKEGVEFHTIKVGLADTCAEYRTNIAGLRTLLEDLRRSLAKKENMDAGQ